MKIISFFPEGYPDEDYRSILIRYKKRTGIWDFRKIYFDLFESTSPYPGILPSNLLYFIKKVPSISCIFSFINEHTYYPLYRPFLTEKTSKEVEGKLLNKQGIASSHLYPLICKDVRFCTLCMYEDYANFGEVYIHRKHQIKYVKICSLHNSLLITKCQTCNLPLANIETTKLPTTDKCPHCKNKLKNNSTEHNSLNDFLSKISIDTAYLLNNTEATRSNINHKYKSISYLSGYFNGEKYSNQRFVREFINYYSLENLLNVGVVSKSLKRQYAKEYLDFKSDYQNVINHILIMRFLKGSVKAFLESKIENLSTPLHWGNGPWKCINKLCTSYNHYVIKKCIKKVKFSNKDLLSAQFNCPTCNMLYAIDEKKSAPYVINWGDFDAGKLIERFEQNKNNIKKTRNELNMNYDEFITRLTSAYKKQLFSEVAATCEIDSIQDRTLSIKEKIIELLKDNPDLSRQNIHDNIGQDYVWLWRREKNWITERIPIKKRGPIKMENWHERDNMFEIKVEEAAKKLYQNLVPRRITRSLIIRQLQTTEGYSINYAKRFGYLPKTEKILEQYTELYEDYQLRRIPHTINILLKEGYFLTIENMGKRGPYKVTTQRVIEQIENHIEKIGVR